MEGRSNVVCRSCCVPYKGVILLLVWTALLHSVPYYQLLLLVVSYNKVCDEHITLAAIFIIIATARALTYLLYPVAGLLGELYWSRYKVMITGTVVAMVGALVSVPVIHAFILNSLDFTMRGICFFILAMVGIILYQFGLGLFEANAIQFGVDQLQFASNDDVSKFMNWYYWALNVLQLIPGALLLLSPNTFNNVILLVLSSCLSLPFMVFSLLYSCCSARFIQEPIGRVNPITHIVKVLRYVKRHTVPVLRSAFTYGEGPPSRLDLAKERYGGPYTTEEVEDVKSFGRILLVLLSQFGILLVDETAIMGTILRLRNSYEEYVVTGFLGGNTFSYIITTITIPIYMILLRSYFQRYAPTCTMLKTMGISLIMVVISQILMIPVDISVYEALKSPCPYLFYHINESTRVLTFIVMVNIISASGYLLNFVTVLKFILAQAPCNMQGLLIGIWYAYQAVAVIVKLISVVLLGQSQYKYIVSCVKIGLAILSFVGYAAVAYCYSYRQRDELSTLNERAIIEEITERQLLSRDSSFSENSPDYSYESIT